MQIYMIWVRVFSLRLFSPQTLTHIKQLAMIKVARVEKTKNTYVKTRYLHYKVKRIFGMKGDVVYGFRHTI